MDRYKVEFFAIIRAHQSAVFSLLEAAAAVGAEEADASGLAEARSAALERLTENYARRQEIAM